MSPGTLANFLVRLSPLSETLQLRAVQWGRIHLAMAWSKYDDIQNA